MLHIHFTAEDLARVHVGATMGPLFESVFALPLVEGRAGPVYGRWQDHVRSTLGSDRSLVARAAAVTAEAPEGALWMLDGAAGRVPRMARAELAAAVQALSRCGMAPFWTRLRAHLEAERDARGRLLMSGGVERLFTTLGPRILWDPPVLRIPHPGDVDVHLDGAGLLLVPSVFLSGRPAVFVGAAGDRPVLVVATPPDLDTAELLWSAGPSTGEPVSALVGRMRAQVLRETGAGVTTTELARQLGVSPASVSQHTRVLREAGLVHSSRSRNAVVHSITSLGTALLGGRNVAPS